MQATVAIWAVLQITPNDEEQFKNAVPLLTEALNSDVQAVRLEATIALGDLGPSARDAVPAIELVMRMIQFGRSVSATGFEKIQAN